MKKGSMELTVGIFVLCGLLAVAYLAVNLGKVKFLDENRYPIKALFQNVSGLKTGARVEISGVVVGEVVKITLDRKKMAALVDMKISNRIKLSDDSIASIRTTGLIGDKFVKLSPGGSDDFLKPGGMITDTESALDIEELIGKYVFGKV